MQIERLTLRDAQMLFGGRAAISGDPRAVGTATPQNTANPTGVTRAGGNQAGTNATSANQAGSASPERIGRSAPSLTQDNRPGLGASRGASPSDAAGRPQALLAIAYGLDQGASTEPVGRIRELVASYLATAGRGAQQASSVAASREAEAANDAVLAIGPTAAAPAPSATPSSSIGELVPYWSEGGRMSRGPATTGGRPTTDATPVATSSANAPAGSQEAQPGQNSDEVASSGGAATEDAQASAGAGDPSANSPATGTTAGEGAAAGSQAEGSEATEGSTGGTTASAEPPATPATTTSPEPDAVPATSTPTGAATTGIGSSTSTTGTSSTSTNSTSTASTGTTGPGNGNANGRQNRPSGLGGLLGL